MMQDRFGRVYASGAPQWAHPWSSAPQWAPRYVGGAPRWAPPPPYYVGAPFPPGFTEFGLSLPTPMPSDQTLPVVQPPPSLPPAASLDSIILAEKAAVTKALANEVLGMTHTIGGEPEFKAAANEWGKAVQAATQIVSATQQSAPVTSKNASARAYQYWFRKGIDEQVASGQKKHPVATGEITMPAYGWSWPPIPQDPEPSPSGKAGPVISAEDVADAVKALAEAQAKKKAEEEAAKSGEGPPLLLWVGGALLVGLAAYFGWPLVARLVR